MCAVTALPMLQIEVAKETRQGAAATESFRNEMVKANNENSLITALVSSRKNRTAQIEN